MDIPNYVKNELFKDKNYIAEMTKASEHLFDSIKETFYTGKDREVKVLRTDTCLYVLDKHRKNLSVGWSKIEDFLADQSTEELLRYTTWRLEEYEKNPKEDDKGELYLLNIHGSKKSEFLEQIKNGTFQDDGSKEKEFDKQIKKMRDMGVEEAFIDRMIQIMTVAKEDPEAILEEQYDFRCSPHVDILRDYTKVLNNFGVLETKFDDEFFKGLNKQGYARRDQDLPEIWNTINYFIDISHANKFLSYEQSFGYNDSDNCVYMHNDHLIVADQTCGFYFDIKDKDNYKVYFLEKEYKGLENEIERIETDLKHNNVDELKSVVLDVKDGKTVFQNDVFMYVLDLCLTYGPKAMKKAKLKKSSSRKNTI